MTEKKIEAVVNVMFELMDILNLAVYESKIFNDQTCKMTKGVCSLDDNACDDERDNARFLVNNSAFLNLINIEIFKRISVLDKVSEVFSACYYDLCSDDEACSSAALFEKYFGGDND